MTTTRGEMVTRATALLNEAVTMVTESDFLNSSLPGFENYSAYSDSSSVWQQVNSTSVLDDNGTAPFIQPGPGARNLVKTTLFYTQVVFLPIVCFIGITGNILNLVVLSRKEMRSSTTCFLIALAVSDLMLCLTAIPQTYFAIAKEVKPLSNSEILMSRYYNVALYFLANVCITCTSWMTVSVTLERFIAIRLPHRVRLICTEARARIAIPILFLISVLGHVSKCFDFRPNPDVNSHIPKIPTALGRNRLYQSTLHWVNICLAVMIPFFFLFIVNSLLVYYLIQYNKSPQITTNRSTTSQHRHTVHITTAVVAMVTVFLFCHSLGIYTAFNIAVHGRAKVFAVQTNYAIAMINNLLVYLNSSVNFILYCLISSRFRDMFKLAFCGKQTPKKKTNVYPNVANKYKLSASSSGGTASTSVSSSSHDVKHKTSQEKMEMGQFSTSAPNICGKKTLNRSDPSCNVTEESELLKTTEQSNNNMALKHDNNISHNLPDVCEPLLNKTSQRKRSSSDPDPNLRRATVNRRNLNQYASERRPHPYKVQEINQSNQNEDVDGNESTNL